MYLAANVHQARPSPNRSSPSFNLHPFHAPPPPIMHHPQPHFPSQHYPQAHYLQQHHPQQQYPQQHHHWQPQAHPHFLTLPLQPHPQATFNSYLHQHQQSPRPSQQFKPSFQKTLQVKQPEPEVSPTVMSNGSRKRLKLRLPLEHIPDHQLQLDESRTRSRWLRKPIKARLNLTPTIDIQLSTTTKHEWPLKLDKKLPDSIDVYLPGKEVWDDYRAEILDEKLTDLGYSSTNHDESLAYIDLRQRLERYLADNPATSLPIPQIPGIYPLNTPQTPVSPIPKPLMIFTAPLIPTPRGHSSTMSVALPGGTPNQYSISPGPRVPLGMSIGIPGGSPHQYPAGSPTSPLSGSSPGLPHRLPTATSSFRQGLTQPIGPPILKPTAPEFRPTNVLAPTAAEFHPVWAPAPQPAQVCIGPRPAGSPHRMMPQRSPTLMDVGEEEEEEHVCQGKDQTEEDIVTDSEAAKEDEIALEEHQIDSEDEQDPSVLGPPTHLSGSNCSRFLQPITASGEAAALDSEEDDIPLAKLKTKRRDTLMLTHSSAGPGAADVGAEDCDHSDEYTNPSDEEEARERSRSLTSLPSRRTDRSHTFGTNSLSFSTRRQWPNEFGEEAPSYSGEEELAFPLPLLPGIVSSPLKSTPTSRYLLNPDLQPEVAVVGRATGSAIVTRATLVAPPPAGALNAFASEFRPNFTFSSPIPAISLKVSKDLEDQAREAEVGRGVKRQKTDQEVWVFDHHEEASAPKPRGDAPAIADEETYERPGKDNMLTFKFPVKATLDQPLPTSLQPAFSISALPQPTLPPIAIPSSPLLQAETRRVRPRSSFEEESPCTDSTSPVRNFELIPTQPKASATPVVSLRQLQQQKKEWGLLQSPSTGSTVPRLTTSSQKKRGCIPSFHDDQGSIIVAGPLSPSPSPAFKNALELENLDENLSPPISISRRTNEAFGQGALVKLTASDKQDVSLKGIILMLFCLLSITVFASPDRLSSTPQAICVQEVHKEEEQDVSSEATDDDSFAPASSTPARQSATGKVLERVLTRKLNELRQDLSGLHSLKVDFDALKRDALMEDMQGRMEMVLKEHSGLESERMKTILGECRLVSEEKVMSAIEGFVASNKGALKDAVEVLARSAPAFDLEEVTLRLSEAVRPQIYQLIDLTSDKTETAALIMRQLQPSLETLGAQLKEGLRDGQAEAGGKEGAVERFVGGVQSSITAQTTELIGSTTSAIFEAVEARARDVLESLSNKMGETEEAMVKKITREIQLHHRDSSSSPASAAAAEEAVELLQQLDLKTLNFYQDLSQQLSSASSELVSEMKSELANSFSRLHSLELQELKVRQTELESSLLKARAEHGRVRSERAVEKDRQAEDKLKWEAEVAELERAKKALREELEKSMAREADAERARRVAEEEKVWRERELESMAKKQGLLESRCETLEAKEVEWQGLKFAHNEAVGELKIQVRMLESELKSSNRRAELSTAAYDRAQSERHEDLRRFQRKEDELRNELRTLEKESKDRLRLTEIELREALEVKASLEGEARSLEQRVNKLDEQIVGLRDMAAAKQQTIAVVNQRLHESEKRAKEVEKLRKEISKYQSEAQQAVELQERLELIESEKSELECQISELRGDSDHVKAEVEKMYGTVAKELEEAHGKNVQLQSALAELEKAHEKSQAELSKAEKKVEHLVQAKATESFVRSERRSGHSIYHSSGYPTPPPQGYDFVQSNVPLSGSIHAPRPDHHLLPPLQYRRQPQLGSNNSNLGPSRRKSFNSNVSSNEGTVKSLGLTDGPRPPSPSPSRASSRATMDNDGWWSAE